MVSDFIDKIKEIDTQLFLFLNSHHNMFFDTLMYWMSYKFFWIPLYAFFLFLVWKHFNKRTWLVAIAAALVIVMSDQISVHAFKDVFLRYRPCHNLLIQSQVHVNGSCGGTYGFISSHAANCFALAMFLSLLFYNRIKYFGISVFIWAAIVSYSRIYNGVHYPADIAGGAIVGMGIGAVVYKLFLLVDSRIEKIE
ncbi:MAG: bcrC [Bacteroidota bacterium]|jgi:undecaprenyl-diphosphatase|nr:bcrC [Bacteroidota bacterium]